MDRKQWLDQVEASLRRAGLPLDYVLRTRTELTDHLAHRESIGSTDPAAMLRQKPKELAGELVQAFRKTGFLRRIPPVLLLAMPLVVTVLMPLIYLTICEQALEFLFDASNNSGEQADCAVTIALALFEWGKLVAPCLGIVSLILLINRIARPWYWTAAIFLLFGITTAATRMTLQLTSWEDGEMSISVGAEQFLQMHQLPQALLVVAVGMRMVLVQRRMQLAEIELLES